MNNGSGAVENLRSLEARWGRSGAVRFEERLGGAVAVLAARGSEAVVALQGAQVLSYRPCDQDDLLWLSPLARITPGKALRGGIPICWPWFGAKASDPSKPAHGFVRAAPWRILGSAAGEGRARLVLAYETRDADRDLFPFRALAEIEITLDEVLTVALTTENRAGAPFDLGGALHSYFRIGEIGAVKVSGLETRPFFDQLTGSAHIGESASVEIDREVDRIYGETTGTVTIEDRALSRQIRVGKQGSRSTVLWNPWISKSARLGDMGPDGYRHMVCVETAMAGKDTVALAPGARHRLATRIWCDPL